MSDNVFCPKHNQHGAVYTNGRPLLDDTCYICKSERLEYQLNTLRASAPPTYAQVQEGAELLAELFHKTYEQLAPQFGYQTRQDTKRFDRNSPNGKLMLAVCAKVLRALPIKEGE